METIYSIQEIEMKFVPNQMIELCENVFFLPSTQIKQATLYSLLAHILFITVFKFGFSNNISF